ncbi:MAG: hypothetical protein MZU97_19460 [Bacillus subtilis]|nr:hypothetical protein [Bacillus subtilis]
MILHPETPKRSESRLHRRFTAPRKTLGMRLLEDSGVRFFPVASQCVHDPQFRHGQIAESRKPESVRRSDQTRQGSRRRSARRYRSRRRPARASPSRKTANTCC